MFGIYKSNFTGAIRQRTKAVNILDSLEINLVRQARNGEREAMEQLFLMEKEYLYKMAFL